MVKSKFLSLWLAIITTFGLLTGCSNIKYNAQLFDFAVEEVPFSSFMMDAVTYDLHADPVMNEGNVMTEYEERFSAKGNKINKYILKRKPEGEAPVDVP